MVGQVLFFALAAAFSYCNMSTGRRTKKFLSCDFCCTFVIDIFDKSCHEKVCEKAKNFMGERISTIGAASIALANGFGKIVENGKDGLDAKVSGNNLVTGKKFTLKTELTETVEVSRLNLVTKKQELDLAISQNFKFNLDLRSKKLDKSEARLIRRIPFSRQEEIMCDKGGEIYYDFLRKTLKKCYLNKSLEKNFVKRAKGKKRYARK